MKLKPYAEALKMAKEKINEALAPVRARTAEKQAELEIAKLNEKLATLEGEIHEACTTYPIDFGNLIGKLDAFALTERKKAQFEKIIKELFR